MQPPLPAPSLRSMTSATGLPEAQRADWERQQRELAGQVVTTDDAVWMAAAGGWRAGLRLVAGLDISFPPHDGGGAGGSTACPVAALAALDFPQLSLRHLELLPLVGEHALQAPYAPGFLGYREVPAYLELLRRAAAKGVQPQLLLVDGFGVLHPRRCGSASHLGVLSGLPTVGVAKHLLHLDGLLTERQLRTAAAMAAAHQHQQQPGAGSGAAAAGSRVGRGADNPIEWQPLPGFDSVEEGGTSSRGSALWLPLADSSGDVVGAALCCPTAARAAASCCSSDGLLSNRGSHLAAGGFQRPIYVSAGHRLSLGTALAVVAQTCKHRVPEPIRQADLLSRAEVRRLQQDSRA